MIRRDVLNNPSAITDGTFDFFNDASDTAIWLFKTGLREKESRSKCDKLAEQIIEENQRWESIQTAKAVLKRELANMTDSERLELRNEIMDGYCVFCGFNLSKIRDGRCDCERDE